MTAPPPPRAVALATLGVLLGVAVALAVLFTSPSTPCHDDGSCDPPRPRELLALAAVAALACGLLAIAFVPAGRPWRRWLVVACVPALLFAAINLAGAAGARLDGLDRPIFGGDPPCDDVSDGSEPSSKCAGDPYTWDAVLLLVGYAGLVAMAVLAVKAVLVLFRRR